MYKFERRVEGLNSIVKKSMEISGIFLSGSLVNDTFDSYSDIDLRFF
jgi:predicted nucleotidyltransferase